LDLLGLVKLTRDGGIAPLTTLISSLISSFVGAQRSDNSGSVIENREVTAGSSGAVFVDHGDHVELLEAW